MLEQRTVVVTGASAGAGRAIARYFGERGWRVALIARDRGRLESLRTEIEQRGGTALALTADTSDAGEVFAARDRVLDIWDRLDVWVNSAMSTIVAPIVQITPEEYRRVTDVTYLGYVHGTLAALAPMRACNRGTIVQVGSALAYRAIPLQSAYCAAKFAIRGFTDSLRTELRHERSRIRVSMVQMPGMNTPQFDWARNKFPDKYQPVGTVYEPEVAARAVYRAALHGPRELWVGGSAIQAIVGQLVAPTLMDRVLARTAWDGQITRTPEVPGRPDNLERTVPGAFGAHGRFGDRARSRAFTLNPAHVWVAACGAGALVAAVLRRRAPTRTTAYVPAGERTTKTRGRRCASST